MYVNMSGSLAGAAASGAAAAAPPMTVRRVGDMMSLISLRLSHPAEGCHWRTAVRPHASSAIRGTRGLLFRGTAFWARMSPNVGSAAAGWQQICMAQSHFGAVLVANCRHLIQTEVTGMKYLSAAAMVMMAGVLAQPAGAQELSGTLKKIKDTGAITIGFRESSVPFSYLDDKQQPVGFAMDICYKIVDAVKKELKLDKLEVKLNPVTSATRIPLMANGTIDLECGSTTNNA